MNTQTWHAPDGHLEAYLAGAVSAIEAASVEQHLRRCSTCRTAIRAHTDLRDLAARTRSGAT